MDFKENCPVEYCTDCPRRIGCVTRKNFYHPDYLDAIEMNHEYLIMLSVAVFHYPYLEAKEKLDEAKRKLLIRMLREKELHPTYSIE